MQERTTSVKLTEAELRLLLEALETRIRHLRDWGHAEGFWKTPAEREIVLRPLEDLERTLVMA